VNANSNGTLNVDIAIVGGGVAGSSLAAAMADAGYEVAVIERERVFRDRVRGEGFHPWGVLEARKLGLTETLAEAGAHELMGWRVYMGRTEVSATRWDDDLPGHPGEWAIYHPTLQETLERRAIAAGARVFRPARVTKADLAKHRELTIETDGDTLTIAARLIVGADGRQSAARRWAGVETIRDPVHHEIGGCLLEGLRIDDESSHMAFFEGGFSLAFPQGGGRARVYVICLSEVADGFRGHGNEGAFIERLVTSLPEMDLGSPTPAGPMAFFPNADIWASRAAGNGVALIGDAAGANDPSLGQGLSVCMRDARELRDALLGDSDWDAAIETYADRRSTYYAVLREYAKWMAILRIEAGPEADARRAQFNRARELDPTQGGFAPIIALGPDGMVADEAARRHLFGEDLSAESA
jgi:2-polyprenyl-6-methoxyphenol hydroxylase-like FAD-dependent oxidoreductase